MKFFQHRFDIRVERIKFFQPEHIMHSQDTTRNILKLKNQECEKPELRNFSHSNKNIKTLTYSVGQKTMIQLIKNANIIT